MWQAYTRQEAMGRPLSHPRPVDLRPPPLEVRPRRLQPYTAPNVAGSAFRKQLDTSGVERSDQFDERVNGSSDNATARPYPLDGWHREPRQRRKLTLIDANEGARCPQLPGL